MCLFVLFVEIDDCTRTYFNEFNALIRFCFIVIFLLTKMTFYSNIILILNLIVEYSIDFYFQQVSHKISVININLKLVDNVFTIISVHTFTTNKKHNNTSGHGQLTFCSSHYLYEQREQCTRSQVQRRILWQNVFANYLNINTVTRVQRYEIFKYLC